MSYESMRNGNVKCKCADAGYGARGVALEDEAQRGPAHVCGAGGCLRGRLRAVHVVA